MKYIVNSTLLYSRLQNIERVISPKNTIEIMSCFLINIKGEKMEVTASDNDTTLKTVIPLQETTGDCIFALEAKKFLNLLKEIPEQPLTLDINMSTFQIGISYQNGHYDFQGQDADNYPIKKDPEGDEHILKITAQTFAKGIGTTIIAASTSESRKIMTGLYVDITPENVSLVSSDGKKLIRYQIDCPNNGGAPFTIPPKPANIIKSVMEKEQGEVSLRIFSSHNAIIESENYSISCRLFEERYPNYRNVLPNNNNNIAIIDHASFLSAMRRALVVADKTTSLIKIAFEPNKLTITAEDINYSLSAEEKLVCQYDGMNFKIGFKGTDLLELLNNIQSKEFIMKMADGTRAGLILPAEQKEGSDLLILLMPLLINN